MPLIIVKECEVCAGTGQYQGEECENCGGTGQQSMKPYAHDRIEVNIKYAVEQIDIVNTKLDAMDTKMDTLDVHLDTIESKIDQLLP